jgi:signal transduction histidine kinase
MRLTHNPEVKKLLLIMSALLVLFALFACAVATVSLRASAKPLLQHQAALIGLVAQHYPDAERDIIRLLSEPDDDAARRGEQLLLRYGYGMDKLLDTTLLRRQSRTLLLMYVSMTILVSLTLVAVILLFLSRRYRTVRQLNEYAGRIASGEQALDIRDNGEGEFSILKNEIYKITTMLKEQSATLQRDKRKLADSIADISHQLKTPLTSLSMMTDLLMEEPAEEIRAEFLERMRSQLDRMEWLVASLLKLSKLDAGTIIMRREPFPVSSLIHRALDTLAIPIETRQIQVTADGDPDVEIIGDLEWTAEAVINILKNGIEHTPEQGNIHIGWESNPIYTRITITDSGSGIDAQDLPYIFNRFYRGKNAGKDSVGIGLAMAHEIVKRQNGDITVKSMPGTGTSFYITFYKKHI